MFLSLKNVFKIKELKSRIIFTCFCVILIKMLGLIPVPGIDSEVARIYFSGLTGRLDSVFKMADAFSGGAFSNMAMLALGVSPYVSATIVVQIYALTNPSIQREMQDSPAMAKRKINSINRYVTVVLACVQAAFFAKYAIYIQKMFPGLVHSYILERPVMFYLVFITSMAAGSCFLVWLSDIMNKNGIGNGISIIISTGILSSSQRIIRKFIYNVVSGTMTYSGWITSLSFIALFLVVLIWSILLSIGQKDIPIVYVKRYSGNKVMQYKGSPILPLRVNYVGIVPAVFASSILMFVSTTSNFISGNKFGNVISKALSHNSVSYILLYVFLIFTFSYVWTSMQFKPLNIASDLKRSSAFIPGVKQGKSTEKYLAKEMHNITSIGAVMLCVLASIPWILEKFFDINRNESYLVGGTTILILVGTIIDVFSQIEGYMVNRQYNDFSTYNNSK